MRVVKDLEKLVTTQEQRRAYDTYIRPSIEGDNRLYQLSEALSRIAPTVRKYYDEAAQAKYNKEVAEGYAASANFRPDEVPADRFYRYSSVNAKEFAKRSRAFQHGVNIHEAEALANTLPTAADEWFRTQTYNGRRIFEIEDPVEFNAAYQRFMRQYITNETGGQIDPQIYQKYLGNAVSQTEHNVTQQFLSERRKALENKAIGAFSKAVSSQIGEEFESDNYFNNRSAHIETVAKSFLENGLILSNSIGDAKAGNAVTNLLVSYMNQANTRGAVNDILAIAQRLPLIWSNDNNRLQVVNAARFQKGNIEIQLRHEESEARRIEHERKQEEMQKQIDAADQYMQEHPNADFVKYRDDHPDLDPGTARHTYNAVAPYYKVAQEQRKRDVLGMIVPPDEVEELYKSGIIGKQTYETYKKKVAKAQEQIVTPIAKTIVKGYMLNDPPDGLGYVNNYINQMAYEYVGKAFKSLNGTEALFNNNFEDIPANIEEAIIQQANKNMQQALQGNDVVKSVNNWRMSHENFTTRNDRDTAATSLYALWNQCKTNAGNDVEAVSEMLKTATDIFSSYCDSIGTWPSYQTFINDLRSRNFKIDAFNDTLKKWNDTRFDSWKKIHELLTIMFIGGTSFDPNASNNATRPNTPDANNRDTSSSTGTIFNDEREFGQ